MLGLQSSALAVLAMPAEKFKPTTRINKLSCVRERVCGTGEGHRTLDTRLEVSGVASYTTPALEKENPRQDLNPYLIRSKRTALPLSYGGRSSRKHRIGFEPMSRHWQRRVLNRARLTMRKNGRSGRIRTSVNLFPGQVPQSTRLHSAKKT